SETAAAAAAPIAIQPATEALTCIGPTLAAYGPESVKKTVYDRELFEVLISPATAPTTTLTVAFAPNADVGRLKFENVTVCCCAGWMIVIAWRRTIGVPPASTVSVTGTLTSWKSPEFTTVATNERS